MDASIITSPLAAFAAGLATSLHCAAMCGPLACAVRCKPANYHVSRIVSYTIAGAILGGAGASLEWLLDGRQSRFVPWLLVAILFLIGFGLDKRIPQPRFLSRFLFRIRLSRTLGWLTPLLPCGPMWLMFGVAILAGSWMKGASLMGAFAVGTVPLYWLLQAGVWKLQQRGSPTWLPRCQQILAIGSALLLVWRVMATEHGGSCCCH